MKRNHLNLVVLMVLPLVISVAVSAKGPEPQIPHAVGQGSAVEKSTSGVYIVLMNRPPVITYDGGQDGFAPTKPAQGGKINPTSVHVQHYQQHLETTHNISLQAAGASVDNKIYDYTFVLNGYAAILSDDQAVQIAGQAGVLSVKPDERRFLETDNSPDFLGLTGRSGPWAKGFDGKGVVVGVIDSGIWPEHPSFADDGTYPAPPVTLEDLPGRPSCDFGNMVHNPHDEPFLCNNKLIGAREFLDTYKRITGLDPDEYDSARDDDGHGTHTASTAAGNGEVEARIFGIPRGTVSGIAPRAHIVAYKGLGKLGGFASDLAAAIDRAVADGVDVINYSIGGGASLLGADDLAYLLAADAGVFVATSAGNSGPDPATIGGPASVPWITSVGASTHDRAFVSDITLRGPGQSPTGLWGQSVTEGIDRFNLIDAEGIADSAEDTSGMCLNPFPADTFQPNQAVLCNQYDFGVARPQRVANVQAGGGGAVIFHNSAIVNITPTDNHVLPTVHVLHEVGNSLKAYLVAHPGQVTVSFTQSETTFADADPRVVPNMMTSFSSRGPDPVALDLIKPDVTAPGFSILAGASPIHTGSAAQDQLFQAIMGTSMSSPHVAGAFALLKQAHPEWSAATAKSALMTTAYQEVRKHDGITPADPFDMGAGHITLDKVTKGSAFQPGLAYDAGLVEYLGFLCDAAPETFGDADAICRRLASASIPTDASDLNLASIGVADLAGAQTVQRTVTSLAQEEHQRTYHVSVEAPPSFDVTVSPTTFTLKRGQSATYYVTITNTGSAIFGQWVFGALSWNDTAGRYQVYSPIAVRAIALQAPAIVSGAGTAGAASFAVQFGYTGNYAAVPHGMVPAVIISDNVVQDPDQNFDPNDGNSTAHAFDLTDAVFARFALPPGSTEPGADLDMYVFDPDNVLVGSSTQADTDEVVEVSLPMDGTYTVYIHGWLTPDGDSDYDMESWVVPAAARSLSVDAAPPAAVSSTVGTIDVSWAGLSSGTVYLGAVSHNRDTQVLGLTVVRVDTN